MKQHRIQIVTPTQSYSQDDDNTILMYIEFGIAQKYIDDLSRNVKRGLKMKAEQGWRPGKAPLGYLNANKGRQGLNSIERDPERFPLVRKMWDLLLTETVTVRDILCFANENWGFRTRDDKAEGKSFLSLGTLYKIFTNSFYSGEFEYPRGGGVWYKGVHEAMITRDEYKHAQDILGRPGRPRRKSYIFAFTGLIRCNECAGMITAENKRKSQKNGNRHHYVYYHCTKRKDPHCRQGSIEEKNLETQIRRELAQIEIPELYLTWALQYLRELHAEEERDRVKITENLKKTHDDTQTGLDELIRMRYLGLIDNEEYDRQRSRLKRELANLADQLSTTETASHKCQAATEKTFRFACYALNGFTNGSAEVKKQILTAVGSNLMLGDKILLFEAKKPFAIIISGLKQSELKSSPLEPLKFVTTERENVSSDVARAALCGIVEEVRTYFRDSNDDFYIPDLTSNDEIREAA
jgi:hypothetical protein